MRFAAPECLLLLLLVPALAALAIIQERRMRAAFSRIGDEVLVSALAGEKRPLAPAVRWIMALCGLTLCIIALGRPQLGVSSKLERRRGSDVAVVLDLSRSMDAQDVQPSRIERAKLELAELMRRLRGDKVGLVGFAGEAFIQCPLTTDYPAVKHFLKGLSSETIPRPGTNIAVALKYGRQLLLGPKSTARSKIILLITDGEGHEGDPRAEADECAKAGISIYAVGVGTERGEPIPVKDEGGTVSGYKKDKGGETVLSRLDGELLRAIAEKTRGRYIHSGTTVDLSQVTSFLDRLEKSDYDARVSVMFEEKFQYALLPGLLLVLGATLLSDRRRVK